MHGSWKMGTATEKRAARGLLGATFDQWRDDAFSGGRDLAREDRLSASDELTDLWPALVCEMLRAGELVARWSEITRREVAVPGSADEVGGAAQAAIATAASLLLSMFGEDADRAAVLVEAERFVDEVVDEHNGVAHAMDAIASFLQAQLICLQDGIALPRTEIARAATVTLAPLVAQQASLPAR